ncbi:MAG: hypothetical protein ABSC31_01770 [Acidimicrobiales bacterium]|jgi:hypothetical protein
MKLARGIGGGVLVSGLALALCTIWPVAVAAVPAVILMVILALAEIGEHHDRKGVRLSHDPGDG